jgi:hypothetical protein
MAVVDGPVAIVPHRPAYGKPPTAARPVDDLITTVN